MKRLLPALALLVFLASAVQAQQKPTPAKTKVKTTTPTKRKETATDPAPKAAETAPVQKVEVKKDLVQDDYGQDAESQENLQKIEEQNKALLAGESQEATYHRMDRNSLTVIPVQLFVPGLGKVDEKTKKPIYTRRQLFEAQKLKSHAGDVLVSEKYFYNKVRFDAEAMVADMLSDSIAFYAMLDLPPPPKELISKDGLIPKINLKKDPVEEQTKAAIAAYKSNEKLRDYMTQGNVGTDVLKIWTNRTTLMERLYYSVAEADKRQKVDPLKYEVFKNLLRKNYVLLLVLINPEKVVEQLQSGRTYESYQARVEGLLYRVDTTNLDGNDIRPRHPLQFVEKVSFGEMTCDPMSEELAEQYGAWSDDELWEKSNTLRLANVRKQAQAFYQNKDYACAKNYYEFVLASGASGADKEKLTALIAECDSQLAKSPPTDDAPPCLIDESGLLEDWIFAQGATNRVMSEMERKVEELKVKSFIFKTDPYITAEIGKKQGVYTDQRFFVYRKDLSNGKMREKRVGTLRVVKVGDNTDKFKDYNRGTLRRDSSAISFRSLFVSNNDDMPSATEFGSLGSLFKRDSSATSSKPLLTSRKRDSTVVAKSAPLKQSQIEKRVLDSLMKKDTKTMSVFKQVDGGDIREFDLVKQNDDRGVGIQAGYGSRLGTTAVVVGVDARIGSMLKMRMPFTGFKIGANLAIPNSAAVTQRYNIPDDESTIIGELYLARELYISRKFDVKPLAGINLFNDDVNLLLGVMGYLNLFGKGSNFKVKLAPEISYVVGYAPQGSLNLRFEF
ncbi:hypothetical protein [Persicitalea jodogahamensis]|uniref:Uncharacterized protein n=1 Tax=Persicitalea jodogahamensis TaxID=402147 RepID=A0A8J3D8C8_9BACT|nr:hypothetical protein [Persicitalea jodogahamensis]GHB88891.1 hypothetical protein GCM10007390_51250 [Persicitalea jodogahamensis]